MEKYTDEEWEKIKKNNNKIIYLNGNKKSFRCDCGCNVFHHETREKYKYTCNSCNSLYTGE